MKYLIQTIFLLLLINCKGSKNVYTVKGTVYELKVSSNKIRIAHDTIPGLMMPMEMVFIKYLKTMVMILVLTV